MLASPLRLAADANVPTPELEIRASPLGIPLEWPGSGLVVPTYPKYRLPDPSQVIGVQRKIGR